MDTHVSVMDTHDFRRQSWTPMTFVSASVMDTHDFRLRISKSKKLWMSAIFCHFIRFLTNERAIF
jgi:hypothetical protein